MRYYFPPITSNIHVGGCWYYCSYSVLHESPSWLFLHSFQKATAALDVTSMLKKKKGGKKQGVLVQLYLFLLSGKVYSFPEDPNRSLF